MIKAIKFFGIAVIVLSVGIIFSSFFSDRALPVTDFKFHYSRAGLTEREAAAHLLDRFTFGATPGQIDQVVNMGLENWFKQQLDATQPDDSLNQRLAAFNGLNLSNTEVLQKYPPGFVITRYAIRDSVISKDSVGRAVNKKAFNDTLKAYMARKGYGYDYALYNQFIDAKLMRAAYTQNQLREVMTDFWFNHFNVSFTKGECAEFIPAYERDVIRPNALGKFDSLLLATAKSPAMLSYLDNFVSQGPPAPPKPNQPANKLPQPVLANNTMAMTDGMQASNKPVTPVKKDGADMMMTANTMMASNAPAAKKPVASITQNKNVTGLNENYAREVMELHTLGVDGGYTQTDVTQAARVLTGWTMYPLSGDSYGSNMKGLVARIGEANLAKQGFVHEGDFLFTPNRHDKGEKVVLGHHFAANGGYQEGVDLLEMLAHHPSTAKFISRKLAMRFVSDNPPQSLIDKMAKTFTQQNGDIKQVLITMVCAPEFWRKSAVVVKTKSPFELAISSVRALHGDIKDPNQLNNWITRMGQKLYYYLAPTGYPDRGNYWINTGSLLNRINFGLALAYQRNTGVVCNLAALNNNHEPESLQAALLTYAKLIMPERKLDKTIKSLSPLLTDPQLLAKVSNAANNAPVHNNQTAAAPELLADGTTKPITAPAKTTAQVNNNNNGMLAQVVGIIIGSPEYQRK